MAPDPVLNLEDEADLMDAYVAGLLGDAERTRFEQKMARDAALRSRVDEARRATNLVSDAYRFVTPGPSFESALTTRITRMIPDMDDVSLVDTEPAASPKMKATLVAVIVVVAILAAVAAALIFK
ncbi:MAG: hypothetical protein ACREJ2_06725 [Planctomycetota bacterium]